MYKKNCKSVEKVYKCGACAEVFKKKSELKCHVAVHGNSQRFECDVCGLTFSKKFNFRRHYNIHSNEKPYACDKCGQRFRWPSFLKEHENKHLMNKLFICQQCNVTFTHRTTLRNHMFTHTGEKPHMCDICGKRFAKNYNLKLHRRLHTGELPFHCEQCDRYFNTKSNLKNHSYLHTGIYPFICDVCKKGFRKKSQLLKHYDDHIVKKLSVISVSDEIKPTSNLPLKLTENINSSSKQSNKTNISHLICARKKRESGITIKPPVVSYPILTKPTNKSTGNEEIVSKSDPSCSTSKPDSDFKKEPLKISNSIHYKTVSGLNSYHTTNEDMKENYSDLENLSAYDPVEKPHVDHSFKNESMFDSQSSFHIDSVKENDDPKFESAFETIDNIEPPLDTSVMELEPDSYKPFSIFASPVNMELLDSIESSVPFKESLGSSDQFFNLSFDLKESANTSSLGFESSFCVQPQMSGDSAQQRPQSIYSEPSPTPNADSNIHVEQFVSMAIVKSDHLSTYEAPVSLEHILLNNAVKPRAIVEVNHEQRDKIGNSTHFPPSCYTNSYYSQMFNMDETHTAVSSRRPMSLFEQSSKEFIDISYHFKNDPLLSSPDSMPLFQMDDPIVHSNLSDGSAAPPVDSHQLEDINIPIYSTPFNVNTNMKSPLFNTEDLSSTKFPHTLEYSTNVPFKTSQISCSNI